MAAARKRRAGPGRATAPAAPPFPVSPSSPLQRLAIPLSLALALALLSATDRVSDQLVLTRSVWAAAATLIGWTLMLALQARRDGRTVSLHTVLRPQHYVQAILHISVLSYWGYHWRPVYDHIWLLVAQLLFAYAFDMLLSWSRRESYGLGFGPFPIIFSTNLFLWFRDDWFYLQFLMLAAGFMGKAFVRWERDGHRTHIFNPSAFSLGLFSLVLIATGTTSLTWGQEIASTLTLAPRIYLFLFAIGLVAMYAFSITLVAGTAAIVLFGASALYSAVTGVPYFIDSEIPSAVFLGLHLLVTDPSTSPRTPLGKAVFGFGYGLGVFLLYAVLGLLGVPTFYDKLLGVPLLNLSARWIDRVVARLREGNRLEHWSPSWAPAQANLVFMTGWILFFGAMTLVGATDRRHRGDTVPFWETACAEGRPQACERLLQIQTNYCGDNAGWACNELGRYYAEGVVVEPDLDRARSSFAQACELRFQAGCLNLLRADGWLSSEPRPIDYRLLLREAGPNLVDMPEAALLPRACAHGWRSACGKATP